MKEVLDGDTGDELALFNAVREDGFPVADGRLPKKKKESRGANSENQSK